MVSSQLANLIAAHGYWIVAAVIALESMACACGIWWMRRHEAELEEEADRAFPGRLRTR